MCAVKITPQELIEQLLELQRSYRGLWDLMTAHAAKGRFRAAARCAANLSLINDEMSTLFLAASDSMEGSRLLDRRPT